MDDLSFFRFLNDFLLSLLRVFVHGSEFEHVEQTTVFPHTPLSEEDGIPYGGCYVNADIDIWAQSGEYKGVRAGLAGVQFVRDGERFGGGVVTAPDGFDELPDEADAAPAASSGGQRSPF